MRYDRPEEITKYELFISTILNLLEYEHIEEAKKLLREKNEEINKSYE